MEAERQLLSVRTLPLALTSLADSLGTSKALIYTYFPDQAQLMDYVVQVRLQELLSDCSDVPQSSQPGHEAFMQMAMHYFEHIAQTGPVIRYVLREKFMSRQYSEKTLAVLRELEALSIGELSRATGLTGHRVEAAFYLLAPIIEESGTNVWKKELAHDLGRQICWHMIDAGVHHLADQA